jgi:hypothetical protein
MTRTRLLLMMIALLLWPAQAYAARGFWGWLEELSGPGPFTGKGFSQAIACVGGNPDRVTWCKDTRDKKDVPGIPQTILISTGWFASDGPRFSDLPATDPDNLGKVRLWSLNGLYLFRPHRSLDIGPGVGFVRLSGAGFDPFYKPVLTPMHASFSPFTLIWPSSKIARIPRVDFELAFFPKGFNGKDDFNNRNTTFDSGPEVIKRLGIVFDFGAVFW